MTITVATDGTATLARTTAGTEVGTGLPPGAGRAATEGLDLAEVNEGVAVVAIVVDDQDGGVGRAHGSGPSGSSARILASRLGMLIGFGS